MSILTLMSNHTPGERTELKELIFVKILVQGQARRKHLINVSHFFFFKLTTGTWVHFEWLGINSFFLFLFFLPSPNSPILPCPHVTSPRPDFLLLLLTIFPSLPYLSFSLLSPSHTFIKPFSHLLNSSESQVMVETFNHSKSTHCKKLLYIKWIYLMFNWVKI